MPCFKSIQHCFKNKMDKVYFLACSLAINMNLITFKNTIFNRIKVLIEFRDIQIMSLTSLDVKASYSAYTEHSGEETQCSL